MLTIKFELDEKGFPYIFRYNKSRQHATVHFGDSKSSESYPENEEAFLEFIGNVLSEFLKTPEWNEIHTILEKAIQENKIGSYVIGADKKLK